MSKRKRMIFPVMRKQSIPVTTKVKITGPKRRYTLLPSPSQSKTSENSNYLSSTSTPIPVRLSHSASHITHSPITHSPITHSPITHSPPQVFQRPYQASPIRAFRQTKEKGKPRKKPKVRRVEIFRPRKSDLRPKAQTQVQIKKNKEKSKKLEMQKVAPPKNQPQQKLKMYKSIKVETGTVNLQVLLDIEDSDWNKAGDIHYTVETNTEQFKWGYLTVIGGGVKPASLNKDWMKFHLLTGSLDIILDSESIGSLNTIGRSFVCPPNSTYEFRNPSDLSCRLIYTIIVLT